MSYIQSQTHQFDFYKLKGYGNPVSSKSIGAISPTALAHSYESLIEKDVFPSPLPTLIKRQPSPRAFKDAHIQF